MSNAEELAQCWTKEGLAKMVCQLDAENAELLKDRERLEWLGEYLRSLTGCLWPQNETTRHISSTLFKKENWRDAIDAAMEVSDE